MNDPKEIKVGNELSNDIARVNLIESKSNLIQLDDDIGDEEDNNDSLSSGDDDISEDYGSSGQKYNWYNGFSDDAIDDAFEGDPEATWNVD